MKTLNLLLLLAFCFSSSLVFTQNWTPVTVGDEYHYQLVDGITAYDSVNILNGAMLRYNSPISETV